MLTLGVIAALAMACLAAWPSNSCKPGDPGLWAGGMLSAGCK